MRIILLAFVLGATSFVLACRHEDQTTAGSPPYTTSADVARVALWDAGPSEAPNQGWDNPKSNQQTEPAPSILQNSGSR